MGIQHWKQDGIPVAELTGPEKRIVDAPSALELAMTARHEAGASALLVDKAAVAEDFFILSTGLAGEILEKFIQYRIKMAVCGDFPATAYVASADFIYKSTTGATFSCCPQRGRRRFQAARADSWKGVRRMTEEGQYLPGGYFASESQAGGEAESPPARPKYNETFEDDAEVREAILRELLGELGEGVCMLGPVRFHYIYPTPGGKPLLHELQLHRPGRRPCDHRRPCWTDPALTISSAHTPHHSLPDERRGMVCDDGVERFLCYAKPVTIGHDCWFRANVVVCPGVTIGENCVIGAGSVVTRDIPAGSFAAGNPARVIRPITAADTVRGRFPGIGE